MAKATVIPLQVSKIYQLHNSWSLSDYKAIIEHLDGESADLNDNEIEEYMQMLIADNEVSESAFPILKFALGDHLSEGQLQNLSNEMEDDKMWEEYPDIAYHKDIFRVNQLLYYAYNGKVARGEACVIDMQVKTTDNELMALFTQQDVDAIFRLVMGGSDSHSKVHRLYDGEEAESYIDDAKHLLWDIKTQVVSEQEIKVQVTSSAYWLDSYQDDQEYSVDIDMDIYQDEEETK